MSCYDSFMYRSRKLRSNQAARRAEPDGHRHPMFFITMILLSLVGVHSGLRLFGPEEEPVEISIAPPVAISAPAAAPTVSAAEPVNSLPTRDPLKFRVGIVSGHSGYDPGAVCDDGLTEAQINRAVSLEVTSLLERKGMQVDLLDEFDSRLTDYQADALVSIHADSCTIAGATGFKVARVTESAIPEAEDKLVACLYQEYARYTGLPEHPASITDNMTNYHAFREIAPLTPGAIIELGFLLDDREILEGKPKVVARGVAAGILCFLGNEE